MRRLTLYFTIILLLSSTASAAHPNKSYSDAPGQGRFIVSFKQSLNEDGLALLRKGGATPIRNLRIINGVVVRAPPGVIKRLERNPGILSIEPDIRVRALGKKPERTGKSASQIQGSQPVPWGVDKIDADLAWSLSRGAGVKIAVLDTGIDKDHPDLSGNIMGGVNYVSTPWWADPDPLDWGDDNGHGSHVAGIIGALDNDIGVIGVAPGSWLYGVKVLDKKGDGFLSDVILGIEWAIDNDMDIITMSLGSNTGSQSLEEALDNAYNAGILVVAAAGNDGDSNPDDDVDYPARYDPVIAVGATDSNDIHPGWSSDGPEVEISAPGVNVYSTWKNGGYNTESGTSMATPHVTGVAALLLAYDPGLSPDQVRARLQSTALDLGTLGRDNLYGYGRVAADKSLVPQASDDFDSTSLDPKWVFHDPLSGGDVSTTVKPGYLMITSSNTDDSKYPVGAYQSNISGDFTFTAKVNTTGFTSYNQDMGIGVGMMGDGDSPRNFIKVFLRTKYNWGNWMEIRTAYRINGGPVYGETTGYISYQPGNEFWLRIMRTGDYVTGHYSLDGTNWISLAGSGYYDNSNITSEDVKAFLFVDERLASTVAGYFDFATIQ